MASDPIAIDLAALLALIAKHARGQEDALSAFDGLTVTASEIPDELAQAFKQAGARIVIKAGYPAYVIAAGP
jgi:hypothetical protein